MPRKTTKRRKAHATPLSETTNRRAGRPHPADAPPVIQPKGHARDKRFDRRPPKFPGRLGGR